MPPSDPRPAYRVAVVGLGGTIAMTTAGDASGAAPALSAEQLVGAVPGLADTGIAVEAVDVRRLPGASLGFDDLAAAADAIRDRLAAGAGGVVLVQGTDTIEETSYLLDLTHHRPQPVVVTGAMRNPSLAGADGPANLLAAIQTAASPQLRDQGVLVVLGDEIHAARHVRKTHATSPATFQSPNGGPLGYIVEGRPRLLHRLTHRTVVPAAHRTVVPAGDPARPPRVGLLTISLGDDGEVLRALAGRLDGLVIAAFGAGHVPDRIVVPLADLAARIPVVLASRTGAGSVLASTYAFAGSESDLLARGLIRAGFLDPFKARILLYALLSATRDRDMIATAVGVAGGYHDPAGWPWPAAMSRPTDAAGATS